MIKRFLQWLKKLFLMRGVVKTKHPKATDVIDQWVVIKYHNQNICLRKREIDCWNRLNRKDRRAMARRFQIMEDKGKIRFQEINGRIVAIKNKDYEAKANLRKSSID